MVMTSDVKIKFDKEESIERTHSGWSWFYGTVTIGNKDYEFTLLEMLTDVGGQSTSATEITWIEATPDNAVAIENLINKVFKVETI